MGHVACKMFVFTIELCCNAQLNCLKNNNIHITQSKHKFNSLDFLNQFCILDERFPFSEILLNNYLNIYYRIIFLLLSFHSNREIVDSLFSILKTNNNTGILLASDLPSKSIKMKSRTMRKPCALINL